MVQNIRFLMDTWPDQLGPNVYASRFEPLFDSALIHGRLRGGVLGANNPLSDKELGGLSCGVSTRTAACRITSVCNAGDNIAPCSLLPRGELKAPDTNV